MSLWPFGRKKHDRDKKHEKGVKSGKPHDPEPTLVGMHSHQSSSSLEGKEENGRPTSSPSSNELAPGGTRSRPNSSSPASSRRFIDPGIKRELSQSSVKEKREIFESLSKPASPDRRGSGSLASPTKSSLRSSGRYSTGSATATPTHESFKFSKRMSGLSSGSQTTPSRSTTRDGDMSFFGIHEMEFGKEKEFEGINLQLPPLQTSKVKRRQVTAVKSPTLGGFGFNLRKSFQPDPDNPDNMLLVHLVEPRPTYIGPLMTGDRILEVNGENVELAPHERVVELIKLSGDSVELKVASVPELIELNDRGVFDDAKATTQTKKGVKAGAGTLRKKAAQRRTANFQAKSEDQVHSDKSMVEQNKVWIIHKKGFSLGIIDKNASPQKGTSLTTHISLLRSHTTRIQLVDSGDIIDVDDIDMEKTNPPELDRVEDLVDLVHLNESSVLHILRQRYGSSLIHTFAGRHMIVINPLRHLSLYSDRVVEMFRGCRREDMPPHIFAAAQQAYHSMLLNNSDQSLVLMGVSGSGKTFNTRYLLRYLATVGYIEGGPVTNAKLDAVQLLLHAFTSAGTFLNPQATRCSCLYSLEFDSAGCLSAASVRTFLLEKTRVAIRPEGELNFNILYQLLAGAATDETLKKELLLNADPGTDEPNHYAEPYTDPQQIDNAAIVWDLIQNCLNILEISDDEAMGLWSILAAIYHLGYAGVKQGTGRVTERFINPAAAMRAANVLGIQHEELAKDIFNPPRSTTSRMSSFIGSSMSASPTISETSSINLSISSFNISPGSVRANRSFSLDAFVMGLFEHAMYLLVLLINRALQPTPQSKGKSLIHVLDTPGFQNREIAGCQEGSTFDDLCMNYTRERLQMLFHDFTFTTEQDRYIQENVDWTFSEVGLSPLSIIDLIDKHVPQRRGPAFQGIDFNERRGLLWILEEESSYSGSNDLTFLEKLQAVHGEPDDFGDATIKVNVDKGQFVITHCQRTLPIVYDVNGWRMRAREHPSTRVVAQILPESKNKGISSFYQGRGVVTMSGGISAGIKFDAQHLSRHASFSNPTAGIKKSSMCLKTKFQLDFLIDILRKTNQWYVLCVLCQPPAYLPGALLPPNLPPERYPPEDGPPQGHIDVPLVRDQLRRADIIPAARIFKQGYPEHMPFPMFKRRYTALLQQEEKECLPQNDKDAVEFIISGLELDRKTYRIGLSQVFFRAGVLSSLDRQVEDKTHDIMVKFQAHIRGWLGREMREKLEYQHAAAHVIQRNIRQADIINNWSWWKLLQKVKPLLAVWKVEEEVKEKDSQIDTLKGKVATIEEERNILKESEQRLSERVAQLTSQLFEAQETAQHATELLEQEQMDRRELQEQHQDITSTEHELIKRNEELQLQVAELSILARIKQSEGGETANHNDSEAVLEKYWETRRELETLRQRISTEHEDELERLQHAKKNLEKKLADQEAEGDDLRRNLAQVRKKASKFSSELNDMKLLLEAQQTRNEELEKRQRKFDADLNAAREEASQERQAKERLDREKNILSIDTASLEQKYKQLQEDYQHLENEKTEIETEFLKQGSSDADSEIASLKRMKRELESKVEELEDELDDINVKVDTLQQTKTRLELAMQTLRTQHQRELEGREEDLEQMKSTMSKKLKSLEQQLEEEHEQKQQTIKAKRDLEREFSEYQAKMTGDPETERKLRKQVKKYKALLQDAQEELEHERETRNNAAAVRGLRSQLEDLELREAAAVKSQKRVQSEMEELQAQYDEVTRLKLEMETHICDLQREKGDLETRLEEEQDVVEQLTTKQRHSITQVGSLQQQLTEANFQIEDLQGTKQTLESKVNELQHKINELESDSNKQEVEASELRIRELEQKLELEKSTNKRQETSISRLRAQLERAQSDKTEETNSKTSDAMKRLQKQLRDIREELQEAERKEQEQNKKRRALETQLSEKELELQTAQSDLKSAHKRIESLQEALDEGQVEEYSSGEDDVESSPKRRPTHSKRKIKKESIGDISSDGSYQIEPGSSGLSDDEELARMDVRKKQREHERMAVAGGGYDDEEDDDDIDDFLAKVKSKHRANHDEDDDQYLSSRKGRLGSDDDEYKPSRKKYNFSDDEEDISTRKKTHRSLDDLVDEKPRHKTDWRAALISDEEDNNVLTKPTSRYLNLSDDDIPSSRRKTKFRDSEEDEPSKPSYLSSDEDPTKPVTRTRRKYNKHDDFSDDDKDEKKNAVKGKGKWSSKFDFSDDDEDISKSTTKKPINKDLDSRGEDERDKSRQSHKSYLNDDNSDDDLPSSRKPKNGTKTNEKKPWELSSDDDDITMSKSTRSSKTTRALLGDKDEDTQSKPRTRNYLANLSDSDDDLPKLKHAPKKDTTQEEETSPKRSSENEPVRKTSQSSRKSSLDDASKKGVQWDIKEDSVTVEESIKPAAVSSNDKSFESSRKRRERRRSRLSNTGTSPENSPKRTSKS